MMRDNEAGMTQTIINRECNSVNKDFHKKASIFFQEELNERKTMISYISTSVLIRVYNGVLRGQQIQRQNEWLKRTNTDDY